MFLFTERISPIDGAVSSQLHLSGKCHQQIIESPLAGENGTFLCSNGKTDMNHDEKKTWNFLRLIPPWGWQNYRNITKSKQIFKIFLKYATYIRCRSSSLSLSAPFE